MEIPPPFMWFKDLIIRWQHYPDQYTDAMQSLSKYQRCFFAKIEKPILNSCGLPRNPKQPKQSWKITKWRVETSQFQNLRQTYSFKQCDTSITISIETNGIEKWAQKYTLMSVCFQQGREDHSMGKERSLQQMVLKELDTKMQKSEDEPLNNTIYKN